MLNKTIVDEDKSKEAMKQILSLTFVNEVKVKDALKSGVISKEKNVHCCDYYTMIV